MIKDDFRVLLVLKRSTAVDMYIGGCWHKANLFVKLRQLLENKVISAITNRCLIPYCVFGNILYIRRTTFVAFYLL